MLRTYNTHLYNHFPPPMKLAKLVSDSLTFTSTRRLMLRLEVTKGTINAADLAMWPTLHTVPTAQTLECRHRYVHCLRDTTLPTRKRRRNSVQPITNKYVQFVIPDGMSGIDFASLAGYEKNILKAGGNLTLKLPMLYLHDNCLCNHELSCEFNFSVQGSKFVTAYEPLGEEPHAGTLAL